MAPVHLDHGLGDPRLQQLREHRPGRDAVDAHGRHVDGEAAHSALDGAAETGEHGPAGAGLVRVHAAGEG